MNTLFRKAIKSTVLNIYDGDTIKCQYKNDIFISRARWIDTPEMKKQSENSTDKRIIKHWEYAIKAKYFLINLLSKKDFLTVIPYDIDSYGRWLCDWYIDTISIENNLQLKLCNAGLAAYFLPFQYYNFTSNRELALFLSIIKSCAIANRKKIGFWSEPNFMLPYEIKQNI